MISCILPVYNSEKYIEDSISSILNQSEKNFELIIINDGSTDGTIDKIKAFKDKRIVLIDRENKGLISSLNEGLDIAKYDLIARMDADDISHPERFKKQIEIMKNDKIFLCGSSIYAFNDSSSMLDKRPVTNNEIKANLLIKNPIVHPTVMMRKSDLRYQQGFNAIEDYKFWIDCIDYGEFYNIETPLLNYRIHKESVSQKACLNINREYINSVKNIISDIHKHIKLDSMKEELDIHFIMMNSSRLKQYKLPSNILEFYHNRLKERNPYCEKTLKNILLKIFIENIF